MTNHVALKFRYPKRRLSMLKSVARLLIPLNPRLALWLVNKGLARFYFEISTGKGWTRQNAPMEMEIVETT